MAENSSGNERTPGARRGPLIALFASGAVVVAAAVFAIAQQPGGGAAAPADPPTASPTTGQTPGVGTPTPPSTPTDEGGSEVDGTSLGTGPVLDEPKNGQDAIDALGDKIDVVAKRNGMTVEDLTHLLLSDSTVHVSTSGAIYYRDTHTPQG